MHVLTRFGSTLILLLTFAATSSAADNVKFHGQVVSTAGGQLTLMSAGEVVRFSMAADVEITLDGQEATLEDLTPDHVADVAARKSGDDLTAAKIEARSQKTVAVKLNEQKPPVKELLFQGKLAEVDGGELVLSTESGSIQLFATTAKTMVTIDGLAAKVADLQAGFAAEIVAERNGDTLTATAVNATTQR